MENISLEYKRQMTIRRSRAKKVDLRIQLTQVDFQQ